MALAKFIIEGGKALSGTINISGAKNAALPILAATLLSKKKSVLNNVPDLSDIETMISLLEFLGKKITRDGNTVSVEELSDLGYKAPYEIVSKMRASIAVMGPLTSRLGKSHISMPGGCAIGPRPIDLHIKGMEALSAKCSIEHGYLQISTEKKLVGTSLNLLGKNGSSVLATENILMAATLAKGKTIINGAAKEPEIFDLATFLNKMGAKISGAGTDCIIIEGVDSLDGAEHSICPDRIETGTFIIAAGITGGELILENCAPEYLTEAITIFRKSGMIIEILSSTTILAKAGAPQPVDFITMPYPLFPTDLQSQLLAYLTLAPGKSIITETIYPDRFMHAAELNRMGANIRIQDGIAAVTGVKNLSSACVMSSDLRGGAALVLAALATKGKSTIFRVYHIDRGYEKLEKKLQKVGADISRIN